MAKITRISAGGGKKSSSSSLESNANTSKNNISKPEIKSSKAELKNIKKQAKRERALLKKQARKAKIAKISNNKFIKIITFPFRVIFSPLIKFGAYVRSSWIELRQVSWPNRKSTWKMLAIVIIYTALFMAFITILDTIISAGINQLIKK